MSYLKCWRLNNATAHNLAHTDSSDDATDVVQVQNTSKHTMSKHCYRSVLLTKYNSRFPGAAALFSNKLRLMP